MRGGARHAVATCHCWFDCMQETNQIVPTHGITGTNGLAAIRYSLRNK